MSLRKALLSFGLLLAATGFTASQRQSKTPEPKPAQATSGDDKSIHEMLLTEAGLLAFDSPNDWERSEGPGFACFVPKSSDARRSTARIYISGAPIGSDQVEKTLSDYVRSDISAFKARFQKGDVHQEKAILLPISNKEVPLYTFKSGEEAHNAIEQVAYIQDTAERVLTVVLSAKTEAAFNKSLPAYQGFVKSFRGSIVMTSDHTAK
jgi:hypothetical protein